MFGITVYKPIALFAGTTGSDAARNFAPRR